MEDYLEQLLRQARTDREEDEEETRPVPEGLSPALPPPPPGTGGEGAAPLPEARTGGIPGRGSPARQARERTARQDVPPSPADGAPAGGVTEGLLDQGDALAPEEAQGAAEPGGPAPSRTGLPPARPAGRAGEGASGLDALYRGVRRESRQDSAVQRAGVAVVRESALPEGTGLTMGRLDRAVRRDSRRYDGGMTIY